MMVDNMMWTVFQFAMVRQKTLLNSRLQRHYFGIVCDFDLFQQIIEQPEIIRLLVACYFTVWHIVYWKYSGIFWLQVTTSLGSRNTLDVQMLYILLDR